MRLGILPKLTKDYILSHVSQEQIFEKYLGIPVTLGDAVHVPDIIRPTYALDSRASGGFRYSGNKLRFKDFAGYFWGDCFDLVAFVYRLNCLHREEFVAVLNIIARDFNLHTYSNTGSSPVYNRPASHYADFPASEKKVIEVEKREWNHYDAEFWNAYAVHKAALAYFDIYPVQTAWVNYREVYTYHRKDPCYAYWFGKDPSKLDDFKLYFPNRDEYKFIMNSNAIEGIRKIRPAEILVITKSYKDVASLSCIAKPHYSLEAIAPASETHTLPKSVFYSLWTQYDYIVSLMDFDFTGRNMAWKLKTLYNVPALFFTNGKVNTRNYGSKDFSDYVKTNGTDAALEIVHNAKNYILKKFPKNGNRTST